MFDHLTVGVSDFSESKRFYETVLAPLGLALSWERLEPRMAAWGGFIVAAATEARPVSSCVHIAFAAKSRDEVDAFHRDAMEAGYRDNGPPGLRPQYHPTYYGAFCLDPDGNNVEAVCHGR
jgi:catechol 2,3-dioxygenase-like lactoylglutathione lyase family enzyme